MKILCECSKCKSKLIDDLKEPNTQPEVYCPKCYNNLNKKWEAKIKKFFRRLDKEEHKYVNDCYPKEALKVWWDKRNDLFN